ncbi:BTB/POZ domain-containing family protein [Hibiscus syriacus]|uniref:BTB/POZ domain-containing family protein n=1 Tax=Hibiscus syriacus TaxID=106335 RepID=A0A6A2WXI6_HIBSY|nr:tetratricopeptide repeat protein 33-like [Hibiscus syriacus]KAE8666652.1 BTB/POZ domain-containing family protein [Hibiscus syriacus]
MKLTWNRKKNNKKRSIEAIASYPNLPFDRQQPSADNTQFQNQEPAPSQNQEKSSADALDSDFKQLAQSFQAQGNKLAEDGKYREALGKWEAALNLMPRNAVLFEQKAQVLLELGDAWSALKAASWATELEPSWAEAWVTLGRAQLNFGEPDNAIESFDRALAIKPDSVEAQNDKKTALHLIKRRKQLHSSGLSTDKNRYMVGDSTESS